MDLRTGRFYHSIDAARAAGVPESDIAEVLLPDEQGDLAEHSGVIPEVRFSNGPFKDRIYKKNERGQLVRVK